MVDVLVVTLVISISPLTGSSDGAHLWDVSECPAAARVAAALHLGVLTGQFARAAAVR